MNINFVDEIEKINTIILIIRTFFVIIFTYYMALKICNKRQEQSKTLIVGICIVIAIINQIVKERIGNSYSIIISILLLSIMLFKSTKSDIESATVIVTISLSINYIIYFIATIISYIPALVFQIKNNYVGLFSVIGIYMLLIKGFYKIKKFKKGFVFLQNKVNDEYLNLIVLNISIIVIFFTILLPNYQFKITGRIGIALLIFAIIMFITIQKSLQMYYKQRLLIQDLDETKKELKDKQKEIEELEKENLNFSKTSHTIAHRQKALEYKLQELLVKSETAEEIGISDKSITTIKGKMNEISKEISNKETIVELDKTGIEEIDDMLKYMQSESIKNKIDFQVQINGNIHHMTNNYINKEDLEILLADHIRNAIIAINHSTNTHRSIFVRLGLIDEIYSLYIYDSGIEFEKETLKNLGKKPSTTHKDEGGTGMGFMNTFDTLNKYKASMEIKEIGKPSQDNYTKAIIIKFDNKNEISITT